MMDLPTDELRITMDTLVTFFEVAGGFSVLALWKGAGRAYLS